MEILKLIEISLFRLRSIILCVINSYYILNKLKYGITVKLKNKTLFQRLIPVDSGNDLFVYKAPEVPSSKIYTIRPYLASDENAVYSLCNQLNGCTTSFAVADR